MSCNNGSPNNQFVCARAARTTVAKALACNVKGDGSAPPSAVIQRFIYWIDTVSGTEGLEMVCVALQELTVTGDVCGDNW